MLLAYHEKIGPKLSLQLKELEADGLVERKEYTQVPPKVEYSLTDRAKTLLPVLEEQCKWGEENRVQSDDKA